MGGGGAEKPLIPPPTIKERRARLPVQGHGLDFDRAQRRLIKSLAWIYDKRIEHCDGFRTERQLEYR